MHREEKVTAKQLTTELRDDIHNWFEGEYSDGCIPQPHVQEAIEQRFLEWVGDLQHYGQYLPWDTSAEAWEVTLSYCIQATVQIFVDLHDANLLHFAAPSQGQPHAS